MQESPADLIIIGAGAGGLLAAAVAGGLGLRAVIIERKHQPGRKLLMCANNRCNLTNDLSTDAMLAAYGSPLAEFLRPSIQSLTPADLREFFRQRGLRTRVHKDGKVFPASEKSADVLRFFSDQLRLLVLPIVYNAAVTDVVPTTHACLEVRTANFSLPGRCVLLATGGVSYPKTGSVGDGQKIAGRLGHRLVPYRPGLVGFEIAEDWLMSCGKGAFPGTRVRILGDGAPLGETSGEIEYSQQGIRGPAIVDASRLVARATARQIEFQIDLCPRCADAEVAGHLAARLSEAHGNLVQALSGWLMTREVATKFVRELPHEAQADQHAVARRLKNWPLHPTRPRPLKEAMVTVGGVSLDQVDPASMQSTLVPGLYFCGEVLDIDGPTGGFNLHAAFATAHLAVTSIAAGCPSLQAPPVRTAGPPHKPGRNRSGRRSPHTRRKSA